ncbi:MAG: protein kinase domain-containing protein [Candidatus Cyclobacteriaceae bacterium M3_2C_046]
MNANWSAIEKHFHYLVSLSDREQEDYLNDLYQSDPALKAELEALLLEEKNPHPLFSGSGMDLLEDFFSQDSDIQTRIGIYQVEKLIGHGAMASVYLARRDDGEFEQIVALKLIRSELVDEKIIHLFKKERQTLAKLQHPFIARLYDGSVTENGIPFFTMEFVEGTMVTQYCEERQLSLKERLAVFLQICQAVKHAHHKLIAHLDLKPGNILVDREGQVKVLDFGIARITEPLQTKNSHKQSSENKRFTLAYASPEQIQGKELDTSSDIFSLGIILNELITGEHPFQSLFESPGQLKLAILNGQIQSSARLKRTFSLKSWKNPNTQELEAICQKATKTLPEERYSSVDALIRDIEAFLNASPLSVVEPSWPYILKKFLQRNYKIVTPVVTGLLMLAITIILYTQEVKKQRNLAQNEAIKAVKVTEFLTSIFKTADPYEVNGDTVTALQLLEEGMIKINESLNDQPAIKASLLNEITSIFLSLGRWREADSISWVAYHLVDSLYDAPHAEIARSLQEIGTVELYDFQLDSALKRFESSLEMHRKLRTKDPVIFSSLIQDMGNIYYEKRQYQIADSLFRKAYDMHQQYLTAPQVELANDLQLLGAVNRKMENFDVAEDYYLKSLAMKEILFEAPHEQIAYTLNHLSSLKQNQGIYQDAIPYAEASYLQRKQIFGEEHIETNASLSNLARIHYQLGNDSTAIHLYQQVIRIFKSILPDGHFYVSATTHMLAQLFLRVGEVEQAEQLAREAYTMDLDISTSNPVYLSRSIQLLGEILMQRETNLWQAKELLAQAYQIRKDNLDPGDERVTESQQKLGACLLALHDYEAAIQLLDQAYKTISGKPEKDSLQILDITRKLELAYEKSESQFIQNK